MKLFKYSEPPAFEDEKIFRQIFEEIFTPDKIDRLKQYIQHGTTTVLEHSVAVAFVSCQIADTFNVSVDKEKLIRGAFLHDYFLYDWHEKDSSHRWHGFTHPYAAYKNAVREYNIGAIEKNIIKRHMFPLTPIPPVYSESVIVCLADKICSIYEILHQNHRLRSYQYGRLKLDIL
ncbi:MAG: HD domain-containing protein [Eubacterium sp.]